MVGKNKPLDKVSVSGGLIVDTCSVIVKQEQHLLSPQSTSSEHSDTPSTAHSYSIFDEKSIVKYEDESNSENLSCGDRPDR